jgi:HK97 family phage portal protein
LRLRNAIKSIFGGIKSFVSSAWREIGKYTAWFSSFGVDLYASDVVRACIRSLSEHTSKANCRVIRRTQDGIKDGDKSLEDMIRYRPNIYMNGKDFLAKVRTLLEINNVVFIYIMRDEYGKCNGLYPMPKAQYEALDVGGRLYIKFMFDSGMVMAHAWDDLAVLRKDYNTSDIWGDTNDAILTSLDLLNTTNEGMANAIKSTANLRGIVKHTKAGLSPDDVKKFKDRFVADYMDMANTSGIASLDAYQEFTPINPTPVIANYKSMEDLRLNIYRYFGINEDIILSKATPEQWEAFYEARIEPFLVALNLELTYKIFTDRRRGYGNEIIFEANKLQHVSMASKLSLVQMVDRGALTANEWREIMNLAPIEGGNVAQHWQNPKGGTEVTDAGDTI